MDVPRPWSSCEKGCCARGIFADDGIPHCGVLGAGARAALLVEGEAGRRQDGGLARSLAGLLGRETSPAPVLRGPRRGAGALRVGLPPPAAARSGGRTRSGTSTRMSSCSNARCLRAVRSGTGRCSSSTKSTDPTASSRRFLLEFLDAFPDNDPRARHRRGRQAHRS